jgi:proline iminopeptidase
MYPPARPYDQGMLDVGDDNHIYWETCGNPEGKPAVVLHGGPGGGCYPGHGRAYDPERYRLVLFDQRGCGRSTPHASDPAVDMSVNTTAHLIADLERLRQHLGIERWLLNGISWGTTLALAYAERYPERVSEIVLNGVSTAERGDLEWLYRDARMFFPEQWERFAAGSGVPRDTPCLDMLAAYARLTGHPDPAVREKATLDWCAWEDAVLSTEGLGGVFSGRPPAAMLALVRICAHYYSNAAWLEEGVLVREAGRLAGIPGLLIHGRRDMSCPVASAWRLSRAWPGAELRIIEDAGHIGSTATMDCLIETMDRFARPGLSRLVAYRADWLIGGRDRRHARREPGPPAGGRAPWRPGSHPSPGAPPAPSGTGR